MSEITEQQVKSLFDYKDGRLVWKNNRANGKIKAGSKAGTLNSHGYGKIIINKKEYLIHRIVFFFHYGYMPKIIDHIDGNPLNNSIENLREATDLTNQYNRKKGVNNTSGCKNVSWNAKGKTWQVHVGHNKKVFCCYVKDFELAEFVAQEARAKFHGEFLNHG
jgi:hypothetical protein